MPTTKETRHEALVWSKQVHSSFSVHILGKGKEKNHPFDFKMQGLTGNVSSLSQKNVYKAYSCLSEVLVNKMNVQELLMPSVKDGNSRCQEFRPSAWQTAVRDDDDYRSLCIRLCVHTADAFEVPPRKSMVIRNADCPIAVISYPEAGLLYMVHCSRDSLLDRHLIERGSPSRTHFSVIDATMAALTAELKKQRRRYDRHKLFCHMACAIAPEHFVHNSYSVPQKYWEPNRLLRRWLCAHYGDMCFGGRPDMGHLDLKQVIRHQLQRYLLPDSNITHDDLDTFSHPQLYSHAAGDTGRNAVIVTHHDS